MWKRTKISKKRPELALILNTWRPKGDPEYLSGLRILFLKNWPIPASFCLFLFFSCYNFNRNWKSVNGVLGIQTRGHRMVGADKTTELWRPPLRILLVPFSSVTRLYDLLDFRQLFQASGNNYFTQIAHILSKFCKGVKSFIFMVKSFLGSPL